MEDEDDVDIFRDEDGDISIKHVSGDSVEFGGEGKEQALKQPSGRTLDDFLEAGFQASKGRYRILPSSETHVARIGRSSSYESINSDVEDFEDDDATLGSNTGLDTTTESIGHHHTNGGHSLPMGAFWRQRRYWSLLMILGIANSSDATEILCISYILADPVFAATMLKGHGASPLAAAVFLGMLLGGLLVGTMGDWIGRRPMLLLGLVLNCTSGILFALAPNFYVLSLLRCVAGFGIGSTIPPLFTLATELAPPSARGFCTVVIASSWMIGSMFVALTALWCFGGSLSAEDGDEWRVDESARPFATWRYFALICSIPSALGGTLVYFSIPESPRFLGLEGRSKEAVEVANMLVEKMFGGSGDFSSVIPLTIEELQQTFPASALRDLEDRQRQQTHGYERSQLNDIMGFLRTAASDFVASTSKLYESNLRRTTLALKLVWFSLSFGSYGLTTWINVIFQEVHLKNVYFNALLFAAASLPGNLFAAAFLDKIQRSTSLIGSIVGASASLIIFAVSAVESHPLGMVGIVASACLFQCFTVVSWNTIDTMTSELFPTLVRSTGWGICAASARIGALIAQFVNGALVDHNNPVLLLLVASGTLAMGALTPCLLPGGAGDMTGRPVRDSLVQSPTKESLSMRKSISGKLLNLNTADQQRGSAGIVRRTARPG
jgi:MFS family permease